MFTVRWNVSFSFETSDRNEWTDFEVDYFRWAFHCWCPPKKEEKYQERRDLTSEGRRPSRPQPPTQASVPGEGEELDRLIGWKLYNVKFIYFYI